MKQGWIEVTRKLDRKPLIVRIRADFVTAVMTTMTTDKGGKDHDGVRIHLGNNNHVDVIDETIETVFNKLSTAMGGTPMIVSELSVEYPGHPDYGRKEAA